jgi:2-polyprenyl-3-methyl-5-hydroxy-6-metoxy-1,4-benzoquinol methylase
MPAKAVIDDYMEYSDENSSEVIEKIKNGRKIAEECWNEIVRTGSAEELEKFYMKSDYHYDVLIPYLQSERFEKGRRYNEVVIFARDIAGKKIMDFGGGPGQLCLLLYYNTNKSVTYVDLPSKIMDFAEWRFKKYSADIECIQARVDYCALPAESYDMVISDAVLEHTPNIRETVGSICRSLKSGGYLYLFFDDIEKALPMHISSHIDVDRMLMRNHLERIKGPIWRKRR